MKKLGLAIALILEVIIFIEGTLPYSMNSQSDIWLVNIALIIGTLAFFLNEVATNER